MTKGVLAWLGLTMMAVAAAAQTTVTTSGGTTNTVPVFTGSATVGNSPITVSGSNVGIGTTSPEDTLHVYTNASPNEGITIDSNGSTANQAGLRLIAGHSTTNRATRVDFLNVPGSATVPQWTLISDYSQNGTNDFRFVKSDASTSVLTLLQSGSVGIGTTNPASMLSVGPSSQFQVSSVGAVTAPSMTFTGANGGTQTTPWTGVLCGGDYAEDMRADQKKESYEPGDVLVLTSDDNSDVTKSVEPYSAMVAGIYATKPGVVGLRDAVAKSKDNVPMAMVGVVPTKVSAENGSIHKGDLLVTSSQRGYAMKGTDRNRMLGAVIGKAMGSLDSGTGVIEVLVTLQ